MNYKKFYLKALKFNKEGQYQKAIRQFDKLIQLNPADADAFSDRGVSKFHLKDLKGALEDMNQSVILEPTNPYRYASRAYILERNGDIEAAILDYKKSIDLDPENAISHNNLGMLEEKLGYLEIAKQRFSIADELIDVSSLPLIERELPIETNQLVDELLKELNIPIQIEPKQLSFWQLIKLVFTSSKMRSDYFAFIKKVFRRRK